MNKALKIIISAARVLSVFGIIFGVIFVVLSYRFYHKYNDFVRNGKQANATVTEIYDNDNPRYTSHFVDLTFERVVNGQKQIQRRERVEVYFKTARNLYIGKTTLIYYKPKETADEIILAADYAPENVPLSRKPFWGWGMTIASLIVFLSYRVSKLFRKSKTL